MDGSRFDHLTRSRAGARGTVPISLAPSTCCPVGNRASCAGTSNKFGLVQANTCAQVPDCPAGYQPCIGIEADASDSFDTCRACCPPGTTCNPLGFCRE